MFGGKALQFTEVFILYFYNDGNFIDAGEREIERGRERERERHIASAI